LPAIGSSWASGSWVNTQVWEDGSWASGAWATNPYAWGVGGWEENTWADLGFVFPHRYVFDPADFIMQDERELIEILKIITIGDILQ